MVTYNLNVTKNVDELLSAIKQLGYGELYGVEVKNSGPRRPVQVSRAARDFIGIIEEGTQYFDVIVVHQGDPAYLEVDQKINGFRCRKKMKVPTEVN